MSAVAEVLGTIVEETGRAAAGSHSLRKAASKTDALQTCTHNSNVQRSFYLAVHVYTDYTSTASLLYLHH